MQQLSGHFLGHDGEYSEGWWLFGHVGEIITRPSNARCGGGALSAGEGPAHYILEQLITGFQT